ncbi:MAG TPA: ABC transporter ATP-binding protein, partial [Planctomycetaceae bacterium]|nr:ABC transporter ATP-binding protein [Planctomycetaceae bacterium]
ILHEGNLVALGEPNTLRAELGSDVVSIQCDNPSEVIDQLQTNWQLAARQLDGIVRLEETVSAELLSDVMQSLSGQVDNISVGRPTLEDVFIHHTGHQFWHDVEVVQ